MGEVESLLTNSAKYPLQIAYSHETEGILDFTVELTLSKSKRRNANGYYIVVVVFWVKVLAKWRTKDSRYGHNRLQVCVENVIPRGIDGVHQIT